MDTTKERKDVFRFLALVAILLASTVLVRPVQAQQYPASVDPSEFHPGYYAYVPSWDPLPLDILINPDLAGVKIKYRWSDLEVRRGVYDFSEIEEDLRKLQDRNKRLWIHLNYVEWGSNNPPRTPEYMWNDPSYGGEPPYYGAYPRTDQHGGWYPLFWNKNVRQRLIALYTALGERFGTEAYVEGFMMPETSAARNENFEYDCNGYLETLKQAGLAAKRAFGKKVVMQQINYACFDLDDFAAWMVSNGIGIGAPDILVFKNLPTTTYPLFRKYNTAVPVGPDVQWDNYVRNDMSVVELRDYTIDNLKPWYVFWRNREPYFSDEVLPAIFSRKLPLAESFNNSGSAQLGASSKPKSPILYD